MSIRNYLILIENARLVEDRISFIQKNILPRIQQAIDLKKLKIPASLHSKIESQKGDTPAQKFLNWVFTLDPDPVKSNTQWMLTQVLRKNQPMPVEDLEYAAETLEKFDEMKQKRIIAEPDINKYKSLSELTVAMRGSETAIVSAEQNYEKEIRANSQVILDNANYLIVHPQTEAAACFWGRDTEWCTAWGDPHGNNPGRSNRFDDYNNDGPLYIIIDRKTGEKWQFHAESSSYMDKNDVAISKRKFYKKHPEVYEALSGLEPENRLRNMYEKDGMTRQVIAMIDAKLPAGLYTGPYEKSGQRFVVEKWTSLDAFLSAIDDDNARTILEIATGESEYTASNDVRSEFITMAHNLPEDLQRKLLQQAEINPEKVADWEAAVETAARRLVETNDDWFDTFSSTFQNSDSVIEEAWERLAQYTSSGFNFACSRAYDNVPSTEDELRAFVESAKQVCLYVDERDMLDYAMASHSHSLTDDDDDDSRYDDEYYVELENMKGGGQNASWDAIRSDDTHESHRENGLVDRRGKDTWLKDLKEPGDNGYAEQMVDQFIAALSGGASRTINDPRQQELQFESLRGLLVRAGLLHS